MVTKHFFKTLIIFILIIAFGLIGILFASSFSEQGKDSSALTAPQTE